MEPEGDNEMSVAELSAESIQDRQVSAQGRLVDSVAADVRELVEKFRVALVRDFPTDPEAYLAFLSEFGTPLSNYSSNSDLAKDDPHPQINRVRYKRKQDYTTQSVHYVGAALQPHSARSWRAPRPAFFSMLMVDPGWRDGPPGSCGESVLLSWRHLFERLARRDGSTFAEHFAWLSSTRIRFQANNVREAISDQPLCYPLPNQADRYDVGVRLKQDLTEKLPGIRDQLPYYEQYRRAVDYLVGSASDPAAQACFPLERGDLLLLDNNRFGHGRRTIVGERTTSAGPVTNPRELWSVTVD
jgi:alpha-ketoglutarate-dependent taurine dioxygenase